MADETENIEVCMDNLYGEELLKAHDDFMYGAAGSVEQKNSCDNIVKLNDSKLKMVKQEEDAKIAEEELRLKEEKQKHEFFIEEERLKLEREKFDEERCKNATELIAAEKATKHQNIVDWVKVGVDVVGKIGGGVLVLLGVGAAIEYDKTEVARNPVIKTGMNILSKFMEKKALKG